MGKIRSVTIGDTESEQAQKKRADARRQTKMAKKGKVEGLGLKGGQRVSTPEESDIKPEFKKLVNEVEKVDEKLGSKTHEDVKKPKSRSKKYLDAKAKVDLKKLYTVNDAVKLVKKTSYTKFDGTVELHVNLFDHALSDNKDFRGSLTLPHGTGKTVKVAIADEKIMSEVENGNINFDILVAHPSFMPKLAKLARILGPKGLMPNPKNGTVSPDPEKRAKELSGGAINFKTEPENPIIHFSVGKVSFEEAKLVQNIDTVLSGVGRSKIAKATISSTMGPGVKLNIN